MRIQEFKPKVGVSGGTRHGVAIMRYSLWTPLKIMFFICANHEKS